jgi:hypothetical protein
MGELQGLPMGRPHRSRAGERRASIAAAWLSLCLSVGSLGARVEPPSRPPDLAPGRRVLLDAHNAYPYQGRWDDRLDRALATGVPLAIEQDLVWRPSTASRAGHSIVSHGEPFTGSEPSLRDALERLRPLVQRALDEGPDGHWPLVTLNLDFKDDVPEHPASIWDLLGEYEPWLTTAERVADESAVPPLRPGPVLVLTGESERQKAMFHDRLPVGARLRLFGAYHPPREDPAGRAASAPASSPGSPPRPTGDRGRRDATFVFVRPWAGEAAIRATNYRRWWNNPWRVVEPGGPQAAGEWTRDDDRRLRALVQHAGRVGLWIRFYTLNGHAPADAGRFGWSEGDNFGSLSAVRRRWLASVRAGVDFIATDQYEELARVLGRGGSPVERGGAGQ